LAKRLLRHTGELFAFVRVDGLDGDKNRAERPLRPVVVQRKVSGGTRTPAGSVTRLGLDSLFQSWHARSLDSRSASPCCTLGDPKSEFIRRSCICLVVEIMISHSCIVNVGHGALAMLSKVFSPSG